MTQTDPAAEIAQPSGRKVLIGSLAALGIAGAALVFFVLPAEFGIDLTGSGESSGLNELAAGAEMTELERGERRQGRVLTLSDTAILTDRWQRELAPFDMVEFKYTMAEGAPMIFRWSATGPLEYDMHSHPFEGGEDLTESYGVGQASAMAGSYVAPFAGIHGWYWQNRTLENVILTLEATGGFATSSILDGTLQQERPIEGGTERANALPTGHNMRGAPGR